ncbi:MAG: hypothetical protein R6U04_04880 [Bacteroidales bacterium]
MKYELDILESIIQDTINSQGKINKQPNAYYQSVNEYFERIETTFIREVFSLKNDQYIELYIQNHQAALIRLSDKVFQNLYRPGSENIYTISVDSTILNLQKLIYQQIENLLSFMKSYFTKYFNHNDKIPEQYRLVAQRELRENNRQLYYQLKSEKNCTLLDIAFYPIKKIHESNESVSFRRLIYIEKLSKEINNSCLSCPGNSNNCRLKTNLIYLNFNSYRFFCFLTQEITYEYTEKDTICGQIEKLCHHLKQINQVQVNSDFIYKPEQKPLNEQLLSWLMEEISYLEKKRELSSSMVRDNKALLNKDFKIITGQSVSQVAFFLKLLVDVGVITNRNQRELIQFVASNIKTKQTTHISPESLRTKYYHVDEGTVEVVKDTIIKLLNEANNKK